jgi:hypothetical protein
VSLAAEPDPIPASEPAAALPAEPESDSAPVGASEVSGPNPASFDWPSPFEVDPLTAEQRQPSASESDLKSPTDTERSSAPTIPPMVPPTVGPLDAPVATPEPRVAAEPATQPATPVVPEADERATTPSPAPSMPERPTPEPPAPVPPAPPADSLGAATEQLSREADDAVNDALSVFGVSRRTPGAQLPATDLFASISGSMRLGGVDEKPSSAGPAPAPNPAPSSTPAPSSMPAANAVLDAASRLTDLGDEEQVRFDLSGFQHGTHRADRELGDSDS